MKVVQLFKIYNFDVVQKFTWPKIQELNLKTLKGFWIQRKLDFSMKFHFKLGLISKVSCQAINALNFCKSTLHKSYKCTSYSNITTERTLHKIIITHITFYNDKKILFKQFKHMMHIKHTQLLCRHFFFNYCTPRVLQPQCTSVAKSSCKTASWSVLNGYLRSWIG